MSTIILRKYSEMVSLYSEDLAQLYANGNADYQYNGGVEEYEDSADLLPRGFGKCTVIA